MTSVKQGFRQVVARPARWSYLGLLIGRSGDRARTKVRSPASVNATRPLRSGPAPSMDTIRPMPYSGCTTVVPGRKASRLIGAAAPGGAACARARQLGGRRQPELPRGRLARWSGAAGGSTASSCPANAQAARSPSDRGAPSAPREARPGTARERSPAAGRETSGPGSGSGKARAGPG